MVHTGFPQTAKSNSKKEPYIANSKKKDNNNNKGRKLEERRRNERAKSFVKGAS